VLIGKTYFIFILLAYLINRGGGEGKSNINKKKRNKKINIKNNKKTLKLKI